MAMTWRFGVSCLLLAVLAAAVSGTSLKWSSQGMRWDLTSLQSEDGDMEYSSGDDTYFFNFGRVVVEDHDPCKKSTGGVAYLVGTHKGKQTCLKLGEADHQDWTLFDPHYPKEGVSITFSDGDLCRVQDEQEYLHITYNVICDPQAAADSQPTSITRISPCHIEVQWPSKHGCGEAHMSAGGTFMLVVLIFAGVYFVAAMLYRRFVLGLDGMEVIPHRHLCTSCTTCMASRPRAGTSSARYGSVPIADDEDDGLL